LHSGFRDPRLASKLSERIGRLAGDRRIMLMHVCGTHEASIVQYGLRSLLPPNLEVRSGPGCPVCVTSPGEIEAAVELSLRENVVVTTFGDMLRVPSGSGSLADAKTKGGQVRVVYSVSDSVGMARRDPSREYVHFAIGFETTAPPTASEILSDPPDNFSVICSHRLIPPAMGCLLRMGELRIAGFILPGHVSTIIGARAYRRISEEHHVPQVVAGFEPLDVLMAVEMLLEQMERGEARVENEYSRVVREEGNVVAQMVIRKVFEVVDSDWRGVGAIPMSGLRVKREFERFDAAKKFELELDRGYRIPKGCRCGEVLRGLIYPQECSLFSVACTPVNPVGPCAVSREGACRIAMAHGRLSKLA
jgi:hydrogenase expression/formation protein HypD